MIDAISTKVLGRDKTISFGTQIYNQINHQLCSLENAEWDNLKRVGGKSFQLYNKKSSTARREWCMVNDYQFACKCVMLDALRYFLGKLTTEKTNGRDYKMGI